VFTTTSRFYDDDYLRDKSYISTGTSNYTSQAHMTLSSSVKNMTFYTRNILPVNQKTFKIIF